MRSAHSDDQAVGMAYYASDADGTGGRLREAPEDFRVRELEQLELEPIAADPGDYGHLLVRATLRDWDTNAFARALANRLGISRERVAWAGTKDKRAVTTQLISITGVGPDDLPTIDGAELEPVGRLGRALQFGDLAGNAFEVTVSGAERPEQARAITDELEAFGGSVGDLGGADEVAVGVPNYFGHQRFGSIRPVTHLVGRQVIRRDWEGAVMAYLGEPNEAEPPSTQEARRFVEESRDWAQAAERFPGWLSFERALCHRLAESGGETDADFRDALEALPWNLRRLFVNAAQSEAFNRMLSRRLERGLPFDRAVTGDVVCFAETRGDLVVPDSDRTQRVTADRVETVNRHADRGRAFVTAPLVGTDTTLGEDEPGEIERAVLDELNLEPAAFALPDPYRSTGTRRAVLLRTAVSVDADPLRLVFELPPGAYATVVLREYLKVGPQSL